MNATERLFAVTHARMTARLLADSGRTRDAEDLLEEVGKLLKAPWFRFGLFEWHILACAVGAVVGFTMGRL